MLLPSAFLAALVWASAADVHLASIRFDLRNFSFKVVGRIIGDVKYSGF